MKLISFKWRLLLAALLTGPAAYSAAPDHMLIFLLIGQSNMSGRGVVDAAAKVPDPRVFVLTKDLEWAPAVDPLHFDKPAIAGVGPARSFAAAVADARPHSFIGLVPAAFGGTSLDQWKKGSKLYVDAVKRTRAALAHGALAGILWHQGEGDWKPESAATYAARFAHFAAELRADLGAPAVPIIVGETGEFRPENAAINAVLAKLPESVPHCAFVSSAGLRDKGDKLHFDTPSQRIFGRRYAEAWLALSSAEFSQP